MAFRSAEKIRKERLTRLGHAYVPERTSRDIGELYGVTFYGSGTEEEPVRRRRRRHAHTQTGNRVLIISEDQSSSLYLMERLQRDHEHSYKLFSIGVSELALKAVERYRPDVIIADNWYDKSKKGYWDVMAPVIKAHPEIRVIVMAEDKKHGQDLPTRSSFFHGRKVITKQDAKWGEALVREVADTVGV